MKIGIFSDVHGNFPALDAVLADMPAVDSLVCLGDIIGYNPYPDECLTRIRDEADVVLKRNYDRMVTASDTYRHNEMAHEGLKLAAKELSSDQIEWLQGLPESLVAFDDTAVLAHSHPEIQDKYVRPPEFEGLGETYLTDSPHQLVALGHTHVQASEFSTGGSDTGIVMNPGSVGQPRDEDWRAAYATVDLDTLSVEQHRVEYDVVAVQQRIHEAGLPEQTGRRLGSGK